MKGRLALLSACLALAGASAALDRAELTDDFSSYASGDTKSEPLEARFQREEPSTPLERPAKRAGQPEYVGGDPQPEAWPLTATSPTTPMSAAGGGDEEEEEEDEHPDEEEGDKEDEDEEEGDQEDEDGESYAEEAPETTQTPGGRETPSTAGPPSSNVGNSSGSRQQLVDSVDPGADEDLLELMVRIAESPAEWRRVHNTLQALDRDLAASRSVVGQVTKRRGLDAYAMLRGEKPDEARQVSDSDSDRRRAELERAGILPVSRAREQAPAAKPGAKQRENPPRNRWPGKTWPGLRTDKHKTADGAKHGKSRPEDSRQHGRVVLTKPEVGGGAREPLRRYFDDEGRHGRVVYQAGGDDWSQMVNRNMDMGRTTDRRQHSLKMLRQHGWLKARLPGTTKHPERKWPAFPSEDLAAWPAPKPARQWPQFSYHRVTSDPRELARQRSAFVAVSVVSPALAGGNRSGEAARASDPLEQQLLQLTARLAAPWSHVRHLDSIKEQMKTMSKMKEKLWRHWLERQKILRENGPGFPRSSRDVAPTTSQPGSRQ
ncbi:death domain-associated protein 6-like [Bacillus rossius redtenbacheri]|uniref:death domain-associated protein 6-like n=1 Tax=Bacillus rossius redtenbacheri TaxID=93214 RepID=UPI002FDEB37D